MTSISISVPMKQRNASSRRADDRLAAHVEAGVDQHRAAGECLETGDQRVIARIRVAWTVWMRAE